MAVRVPDLFPLAALHAAEEAGFVRFQTHPRLPYRIYNYTERCAYARAWDDVTRACRGLIVDEDWTILARPFPKFFNYGEPSAPELDLDASAVVTEKLDGSLGILYPTDEGYAVATRGSFTSDQALHATEVWKAEYGRRGWPESNVSWLFEIVYPANRIVVDYGDTDDLILLAGIDTETGLSVPVGDEWPGPRAETHPYRTLAAALAAEPRPNTEGFVVYFPDSNERVKIKQEDYVALHRIVTGLNARTVWEHLRDGKPLVDLLEPLPAEFHDWVREVAEELHMIVYDRVAAAKDAYDEITGLEIPADATRKDFALRAALRPERALLFLLYDGKDIVGPIWRDAKPEAQWNPANRSFSEDVA